MIKTWSFYALDSGVMTGGTFQGPEHDRLLNTPIGCGAYVGVFDHLSQRVDIMTGTVVAYQPPPPAADDMRSWSWDASISRWVASPTVFALASSARERRNALLSACDWTQTLDSPLTLLQRAAWVTYRLALREVPEQATFPTQIDWPVPPA